MDFLTGPPGPYFTFYRTIR